MLKGNVGDVSIAHDIKNIAHDDEITKPTTKMQNVTTCFFFNCILVSCPA